MARLLRFKDMYVAEYRPGEDELINYRAKRRKNGAMHEEHEDVDEALNMAQRRARQRLFKRLKSKIKLGRDRAKRKMASPDKLKKRALKQARMKVFLKISKGVKKDDMSFARRQEMEKRLDKPVVKKRIAMLAKKMLKDVRKKEVERKKG
tara:strand:- start:2858 stop:3307 length:450 start_codon:yes stop_codon:yes gene_type:complete